MSSKRRPALKNRGGTESRGANTITVNYNLSKKGITRRTSSDNRSSNRSMLIQHSTGPRKVLEVRVWEKGRCDRDRLLKDARDGLGQSDRAYRWRGDFHDHNYDRAGCTDGNADDMGET